MVDYGMLAWGSLSLTWINFNPNMDKLLHLL